MIYITGDTHGDPIRFIENNMGDNEWTKDDYLIICGDFGYVFFDDDTERDFLNYLVTKPYTICFCDGNHENFPAIYAYPEIEWNGGRVHQIRKNILHLCRGQVFSIDGKKIFTMGGANSVDRAYRTEGISWWPEEQPSDEEYDEGLKNLEKCGWEVDFIITHTAPQPFIDKLIAKQQWNTRVELKNNGDDYRLMGYLGQVLFKTKFSHWYFGHWHFDMRIDDQCTAVYFNVHSL